MGPAVLFTALTCGVFVFSVVSSTSLLLLHLLLLALTATHQLSPNHLSSTNCRPPIVTNQLPPTDCHQPVRGRRGTWCSPRGRMYALGSLCRRSCAGDLRGRRAAWCAPGLPPTNCHQPIVINELEPTQRHQCYQAIATNYRPISLLNSFYKIYLILIRKRLHTVLEDVLTKTQFGFRPCRSTSHALSFFTRRMQDIAEQQGSNLIITFLDWENAFDKVQREIESWRLAVCDF